jgi:type IV pilus assembly protein PilM
MGFVKKNHLVGLDIGSSVIKAAEIQQSKKGNYLKRFGMAAVAPGAIADGRIMDMRQVAQTIDTLFQFQKIREKNVALSVGGPSVMIKTIHIPSLPEKELTQIIAAEAVQYLPWEIEQVHIDYQILGESEFSSDQVTVLVAAVRKDLVAQYTGAAAMAGLNARIVDVDTFALHNIYQTLPDRDPDDMTLLLDVGASKTSLNIFHDDISLLIRANGSGTFQIIEEIAARFETDARHAEKILQAPVADAPDPEILASILQEAADFWCSDIADAVHPFLARTRDARITRTVLSGGGSHIQALSDRLKGELGADVHIIRPFEGLNMDDTKFSSTVKSQVGPQAAVVLGLALRRLDDK